MRPIALCAFQHAGRILVATGCDRTKNSTFFRPLGGRIEFGERAVETLQREIREEINAEIEQPELLGVLENIFVYEGQPGHEIAFVFDATFSDPSMYARSEIPIVDAVTWHGPATWERVDALSKGSVPVYPVGLFELLRSRESRVNDDDSMNRGGRR